MTLNPVEARVLGALIEKEMATPEYYPLSLHALVNACNQKSNRSPVLSLDEGGVSTALAGLRAKGMAAVLTGGDNRVPKHSHRGYEALHLGNREMSLLCVLLLRGPQTVGELRARAESLHAFEDLDAVESCLQRLMEREEPLVFRLPRQPGTKEPRYAHLFCGPPEAQAEPEAQPEARESRLDRLEAEVAELRRQFAEFRKQFE